MVEPSILNVFIKIKHHFVLLKSTYNHLHVHVHTESYQLITFSNCRQVWSIDTLSKALQ